MPRGHPFAGFRLESGNLIFFLLKGGCLKSREQRAPGDLYRPWFWGAVAFSDTRVEPGDARCACAGAESLAGGGRRASVPRRARLGRAPACVPAQGVRLHSALPWGPTTVPPLQCFPWRTQDRPSADRVESRRTHA